MLHAYTPHRKTQHIYSTCGRRRRKTQERKENTRVDLSCVLNEVIVVYSRFFSSRLEWIEKKNFMNDDVDIQLHLKCPHERMWVALRVDRFNILLLNKKTATVQFGLASFNVRILTILS